MSSRSVHSRWALATHRSAIAFARGARTGVRMIRADRGEHRVERVGELRVAVPDQEPDRVGTVLPLHE
jgi:hypothetical protein